MGWKLYSIIYKAKNNNQANLIKQIENSTKAVEYLKTGKKSFSECMNPKDDFLYIGKFKDYLIINEANLALDFFQESTSKTERFWRTLSRNSQDIYCFVLESVACMYGFAYLSNQRKIRCQWGYLDEPIKINIGTPLASEKEYYEKENIDALLEDEEIEFHQIGEDVVFHLMKSLLGESPITFDSDLMNIEMTEYKKIIVDDIAYQYS